MFGMGQGMSGAGFGFGGLGQNLPSFLESNVV